MSKFTPKSKKLSSIGFTLIEVLVVMAITGVLGLGVLSLQYVMSESQVSLFKNYTNVEEANSNISTLVREIRNTQYGENGAYPLNKADDQELIFFSDYDYDGQAERVRYYLDNTQFSKGVIEPVGSPATYPDAEEKTKVLSENVRNDTTPIFYYYNGDWPTDVVNNPLNTPTRLSETKLMKVYLEINTQANQPERNYILESYVQLRSLKQNL
jgi:prepilin-type N-terminal cleavage/methylation domain-containing protein